MIPSKIAGLPSTRKSHCHPASRTDSMENEIARYFEQTVAQEEHAGTETKRSRTESEIGIHLQPRKPNVHPVEPRDDVEDKQKGYQPQCDFAQSYRREIRQFG